MIFDTGVFIALDRPSTRGTVIALVEKMMDDGVVPATNEPVLAQAWRNPAVQVPMARLVAAMNVYPFGDPKTVGLRCAHSGTSDVVDASVAVLADQLDVAVLTTDPVDMATLDVRHITL